MRTRSVLASEAARHGITDTPRPQADLLTQATSFAIPPTMPEPMRDAVARSCGNLARIANGRMHLLPPPQLATAQILDAAARGMQARAPIGFVGSQTSAAISKTIGTPLPAEANWVIEADQIKYAMDGHPEITGEVIGKLPEMLQTTTGVKLSEKAAAARRGNTTLQVRCKDSANGQQYEIIADLVRKQTELSIYTLYKVKP